MLVPATYDLDVLAAGGLLLKEIIDAVRTAVKGDVMLSPGTTANWSATSPPPVRTRAGNAP